MAGERDIQILSDGVLMDIGVRLAPRWFEGHNVIVRVNNKDFTMGEASGDGCNCLIDTLRQSLGVICNVSDIRSMLEQRHAGKASHIAPGSYLELEPHWRDIVDLLSRHNLLRQTFQADRLRIVCVDVNLPGHGDVFPQGNDDGRFPLHIARQSLNHFVPLIRHRGNG